MVLSYLLAQLIPWTKDQKGFLLVLASANIAEGLRGYMTKYDCSAADINPIGGINKTDILSFLRHISKKLDVEALSEIAGAKPTAELRPTEEGKEEQLDEVEMGMTYDELDTYGRLRKIERDGPLSMFEKLLVRWGEKVNP